MPVNPRSRANLKPGGGPRSTFFSIDDTIGEYIFLLGARRKSFDHNINNFHARRSADLYRIAEQHFNAEVRRPTSSGDRPGERMTGRFTFGSGKTFRAVLFKQGQSYGIGFPDTQVADNSTNGVWRVHEFGLPSSHPEGPKGQHRLPSRFHWDPARGDGARLVLGADPSDRYRKKGSRNTRATRQNTERLGQGVPAKNGGAGFIRPAFTEFRVTYLEKGYRQVVKETFKLG